MAENNLCLECDKLRLTLIEKNNEIEKLKLHIKNLTNFLLWNDSVKTSFSDINDFSESVVYSIKDVTFQKFYLSDLFFKSRDSLDNHVLLVSKSIQTDSSGDSVISEENITNTEEHQVENVHDYVYDKNYHMYYSSSTGYYYDDKSGLMYEPQSGTYYKYNYDKKEYEKIPQEEQANNDVYENEMTNNFICQSVVDQVNNLNLNDDSLKAENFESEVKNTNTLRCENSANESCITVDYVKVDAVSSGNDNISLGCSKDWQPEEGSKMSVSDMVKQAVEEHNNMSDYIYDEEHRMYYSPSTGYFYDAVRNLLYDPTSGIYYFYDSAKQTYEFYCQTHPISVENKQPVLIEDSTKKEKLKSRKLYWKKKLELSAQSPKSPKSVEDNYNQDNIDEEFSAPEDGEIFSSDEESDSPVFIVKSPIRSPSSKQKNTEESFPPSIRAIVENSENLQIGSLILITCSGGIIGRDKANAVYLPDICVSKIHANIKYDSDFQNYSIEDLGSQNGTFINDKRLSEPKLKSEPHILNHGDKLSLGSCKLLIHIHEGYDTCDYCEPGQVLAELASDTGKNTVFISKEEKEKHRRQELRKLKKKYGLQGSHFEEKSTSVQGYEDKAEIRRQTVGSDNPYEKTEETSVDVSMPKSNKGYQMLKKMGWKEGETLGPSDSGLVEPIPLRPWTGTAGLGSCDQRSSRPRPLEDKKAMKWVKARERYFQLSVGRDTHPDENEEG